MKERIIFLSLVTLIAFTVAACSKTEEPVTTPGSAPVTEAEKASSDAVTLLEQRCTKCHTTERIYLHKSHRMSKELWGQIVDRMIGKGAKLDADERHAVIDYLSGE